jgi:hypothetical protein
MDFRAIADTAFDDLLILREAAAERGKALRPDIKRALARYDRDPDTMPDCQDALVRIDVLERAGAMARTQDLNCHVLNALGDF